MLSTTQRERSIPFVAAAFAAGFVGVLWIVTTSRGVPWLLTLDDGYIHARLAQNLADTGTLGLNPGEGGGGSSSLLWTVLLTLFAKLGLAADRAAWVCSTGGWLLAVWAGARWYGRQLAGVFLWIGALALALSGQLAALSQTGMETLLTAAFLFLALDAFHRRKLLLTLLFASLAALTRAETVLLPFAMVIASAWRDRNGDDNTPAATAPNPSRRDLILYAVVPLGVALAGYGLLTLLAGTPPQTLAARRWLVDLPPQPWQDLPQTLLHMVRMTGMMWERTVNFVGPGHGFGLIWALLALGLGGAGALRLLRSRDGFAAVLFLAAHLGFYLVFLPHTGHMGRYVWPVWVLGPVLVVAGLMELRERFREAVWARYAVFGVTLAMVLGFFPQGFRWVEYHVAAMKHLNTTHLAMAEAVREEVPLDEVVAAFDVGLLSWAGGHRILDMGGLCGREELKALQDYRMGELIRKRGVRYVVLPETEGSGRFVYAYRLGLRPQAFVELERVSLGNQRFVHIRATVVAMKALGLYRMD